MVYSFGGISFSDFKKVWNTDIFNKISTLSESSKKKWYMLRFEEQTKLIYDDKSQSG